MSTRHQITCGFLPLLDSALLIVAREQGFAEDEGVDLALVRESSWANIRDRMAVGHFQVAHLLAPMPIAFNLGLSPMRFQTIAPMALGLGGNAITASNALWAEMLEHGARDDLDPANNGRALAATLAARARHGAVPLQMAVVHPHSVHNYELRYWLAASGVVPDRDLSIQVVPPSLMGDAIAAGRIDAFCVGEPYNTLAVASGNGHLVTVKSAIWRSSPEKVLGVAADWAEREPEALARLLRALYRSARWCDDAMAEGRQTELAAMLAADRYLACATGSLLPALTGRLNTGDGLREIEDFFLPFARAANFPWVSHAAWIYTQMVRWRHVVHTRTNLEIARASYRPDIYRRALAPIGAPVPGANGKVEGALAQAQLVGVSQGSLELGPDGFFDGRVFDPDEVDRYLADA
ncbi:MAG: ABC transporter substrate-binding protein [Burkholderiaceae bacterium]|nr:ABC transporter substrate-binding protein [Burkholderiaceae bacterium]